MEPLQATFLRSLAAIGIVAPGIYLPTAARAQDAAARTQNQKIQARAEAAYNAFNSAFLEQLDGQTYYTDGLNTVSITPDGEWEQGLDIVVAEDRYQYTHAQADRDLVISLLNSLAYYNAPGSVFGNWQTDGWDDNLAWMVNAFLRGYQLTGVSSYLTEAEAGWNNGWNQGWDTTVAGGGIWRSQTRDPNAVSATTRSFGKESRFTRPRGMRPTWPRLSTYAIQNSSSNRVVSVADASTINQAAIVQMPYLDDAKQQQWTFKATSGGYYRIKNANSGAVISVAGASGIKGAAIVQRPAQAIIPGDGEWMPVLNADGTYSFYNLNSLQALDNPGGSTNIGKQLDQWFGNNTNAQEFYLVRLS